MFIPNNLSLTCSERKVDTRRTPPLLVHRVPEEIIALESRSLNVPIVRCCANIQNAGRFRVALRPFFPASEMTITGRLYNRCNQLLRHLKSSTYVRVRGDGCEAELQYIRNLGPFTIDVYCGRNKSIASSVQREAALQHCICLSKSRRREAARWGQSVLIGMRNVVDDFHPPSNKMIHVVVAGCL